MKNLAASVSTHTIQTSCTRQQWGWESSSIVHWKYPLIKSVVLNTFAFAKIAIHPRSGEAIPELRMVVDTFIVRREADALVCFCYHELQAEYDLRKIPAANRRSISACTVPAITGEWQYGRYLIGRTSCFNWMRKGSTLTCPKSLLCQENRCLNYHIISKPYRVPNAEISAADHEDGSKSNRMACICALADCATTF